MNRVKLAEYIGYFMSKFDKIGEDVKGGVTRLGYTDVEDLMHEQLHKIANEAGYYVEVDEVGNSFISIDKPSQYNLIGSHLDSVINGGKFDGPLGVATGFAVLKAVKENNLKIPLKVVAFRCEESSNFMMSTIGSHLITREYDENKFKNIKDKSGKMLVDIFKEREYNIRAKRIEGVLQYLELHIEQGRILESENLKIGVVTEIAGNKRLQLKLLGMAEHSGATPMNLRKDALCSAAEIILAIEKIANSDGTKNHVCTVGVVENFPNAVNVVPGETHLSIDIRDGNNDIMNMLEEEISIAISSICKSRAVEYELTKTSSSDAVEMDEKVVIGLSDAAKRLGIEYRKMPSGAGHDAMKFPAITKTGMLFVPCKDGVSHNPKEYASIEDAALGAEVFYEYLKGEYHVD